MSATPVVELADEAHISLGDLPTGGLTALALEGWFRVDVVRDVNRPLLIKYGAGSRDWALYVTLDGRLYAVFFDVSGGNSVGYSAAGTVVAGAWGHYAGCYDAVAGHVKVWLNGTDVTEVSRATGNAVADTARLAQIGGYIGEASAGFGGAVGWCRVSSGCRSGTPAPGYLYPAVDGLTVAQWNLTEGAGTALANAQGNPDYAGLIVGGTWGWFPTVGMRAVTVSSRPQTLRLWARRGA